MNSFKNRAITVAKIVGDKAIWLWRLPFIRSVVLTQIARIGLGSTITAIVVAIVDGLAQ